MLLVKTKSGIWEVSRCLRIEPRCRQDYGNEWGLVTAQGTIAYFPTRTAAETALDSIWRQFSNAPVQSHFLMAAIKD